MSTIVRSHNGGHHYHPHYHHHDIARWRACKLWSCSASSSPDRLTRGSKLSSSLVVLITTVCYHNQHCCAHCYLYWWQPPHHFKAKVKRSGGNWNMRGKLLCVISRKLLSQFVIMSRHLPHHNDYRKLKVHHPNPHHYEPTQVRCDEPPQSLLAAGWKAPCPRNRSFFLNERNYISFEISKIIHCLKLAK